MLRFLISRLPESQAQTISQQVLKSLPGRRLLQAAAGHPGVDSLLLSCAEGRVKAGTRSFAMASRILAGEIHCRGQTEVRRQAQVCAASSKREFDRTCIAIHAHVWGQELCEQVCVQAWGKLGKERRTWMQSDERSRTDRFGIDVEFMNLFVDCEQPVYEEIEVVGTPLAGRILRLLQE